MRAVTTISMNPDVLIIAKEKIINLSDFIEDCICKELKLKKVNKKRWSIKN